MKTDEHLELLRNAVEMLCLVLVSVGEHAGPKCQARMHKITEAVEGLLDKSRRLALEASNPSARIKAMQAAQEAMRRAAR